MAIKCWRKDCKFNNDGWCDLDYIEVNEKGECTKYELDEHKKIGISSGEIFTFNKNSSSTDFIDDIPRGVFAIRSPKRPNPIGITVVRLLERKENILKISGVDMVDETPLLDIKPYFPEVDAHNTDRTGWMGNKLKTIGGQKLADNRFR